MKQHRSPHKNYVGPFLKWVGGKSHLLNQFETCLPRTLAGRRYVEPFMGSAAVFFHVVQNLGPESCTLLDVNVELVNAFQQVRDNVEAVIRALDAHRAHHNVRDFTEDSRKAYYYEIRSLKPEDLSPEERAARFIYLNKTCYNGLHRMNSRGEFNVPMGSYRLPAIFNVVHLREVSRLLQGVLIEVCPFQQCEHYIGSGDFVYFDPPYEPLSATSSFTRYAADGFTGENQRELRDLVDRLSDRCECMVSNSTAPLIEELYAREPFRKQYVMAGRAINSDALGRGKIRELLVMTYPAEDP